MEIRFTGEDQFAFTPVCWYGKPLTCRLPKNKPEGHTLTGVEIQSAKYADGLPDGLPYYHLPLPFAYESTGVVIQFTNGLEPDPRSREVFTFHRPDPTKHTEVQASHV